MILHAASRARHRSALPDSPNSGRWLLGLLLADVLLLLANVGHLLAKEGNQSFAVFGGYRWHGDNDRSFIELAGNLQLGLAALVLAVVAWKRYQDRHPGPAGLYAAWGAVFLAIVLDDFLMVHEKVGRFLADRLALPSVAGLRPVDLGELLVWGIIAVPLGLVLLWRHHAASASARAQSLVFVLIAGGLVIFAVGVDMLHSMTMTLFGPELREALTFLETTGELVAMTLFLAWSISIRIADSVGGAASPTAS